MKRRQHRPIPAARAAVVHAPRLTPEEPMKTEHAVQRAVGARFDAPREVDESFLDPDALVAVGVGYAAVTRDGVPIYEADCGELEDAISVRDAEAMAAAEPGRDWRIHLVGPLDERHYRRGVDGRWTIYSRGYGLS
jgi:hypothetical protein